MNLQALRQRCETRLRDLPLAQPFDLPSFCRAVAAWRGRPLELRPVTAYSGPYGAWVAGPTRDVVFYEQGTTRLHRDHIILHEISHIACGHDPIPLSDPQLTQLLCPHIDPLAIQLVLSRASYSTDEECEAELLASLILEQMVGGPPREPPPSLDAETEGVLRRLEASLERKDQE